MDTRTTPQNNPPKHNPKQPGTINKPLSTGPVHFRLKGCWVVHAVFICIQILIENLIKANSGDPDQTRRFLASDHVLHCLPMSSKKDARLEWSPHRALHSCKAGLTDIKLLLCSTQLSMECQMFIKTNLLKI